MITRLSVNINKVATLRNSRNQNVPNLLKVAQDIEKFGAQGITVHPRPDQRHIYYKDVERLKGVVSKEFNIEGNPTKEFMDLVIHVKPTQVTLVPDKKEDITSTMGWDTRAHESFLKEIIQELHKHGIRSSIFLDPTIQFIESAARTQAKAIEFHTKEYALTYVKGDKKKAIDPYIKTAKRALDHGLEIHAGHDLNLDNIKFLIKEIPEISEVSIGHALICEALYMGLEHVVKEYLKKIQEALKE